MHDLDRLKARLEAGPLAHRAQEILAATKPSLKLVLSVRSDDSIPIGASKFGGHADLPAGVDWPMCKPYGAVPLRPFSFVAQINLREVPRTPGTDTDLLPATGLLSFFCDNYIEPPGSGAERVLLFPESPTWTRRPHPPGRYLEPDFRARAVHFQRELSLPPETDELCRGFEELAEEREYDALLKELRQDLRAPSDRMFGHPNSLHGNGMDAETRLLLQVDSDAAGRDVKSEQQMCWGDGGRLMYFIDEHDLRMGRFDKVFMAMECS